MDLSTTYMGLKLKNPVVPSASPLSADLDAVQRMAESGAAAIVLHSLFEEQISHEQNELDHHLADTGERYAEMISVFPDIHDYRLGPEEYLGHIQKVKKAVDIPIIASLNGVTVGGWTEYAKKMEAAGADALELNVYYIAADAEMSSQQVEDRYVDVLKAVKGAVGIPVSIKIGPYFSSTAAMCRRLDEAGADGLVLFNRFYQPDINLDELEVVPDLVLSSAFEMRLPLRWVAILHDNVKASLAATTGIATGPDVIKMVMAGADVTQVCSVLLRKGAGEVGNILREVNTWMEKNEYESIEQMKGSMSQRACPNPTEFERANYMKTLNSYT